MENEEAHNPDSHANHDSPQDGMSEGVEIQSSDPVMRDFWCYQCNKTISANEAQPVCPECSDGFIELITHNQMDAGTRGISILLGNGPNDELMVTLQSNRQQPLGQLLQAGMGAEDTDQARVGQMLLVLSHLLQRRTPDDRIDHLLQLLLQSSNGHSGAPPASAAAIAALEKHTVEDPASADSITECSICMDQFERGVESMRMPCKHLFHESCLVPWLSHHNSCPVCRFELATDDADYEQQRQQASPTPNPFANAAHTPPQATPPSDTSNTSGSASQRRSSDRSEPPRIRSWLSSRFQQFR